MSHVENISVYSTNGKTGNNHQFQVTFTLKML